MNLLCWLFEPIVDDWVEKCHILEHWVGVLFSVTTLDPSHKVEASGALGSLGSVLSPQMLKAANVKPAVAAYSLLRPGSCFGLSAESLHGKDSHWYVGDEYNFLLYSFYKVIQTVVIR